MPGNIDFFTYLLPCRDGILTQRELELNEISMLWHKPEEKGNEAGPLPSLALRHSSQWNHCQRKSPALYRKHPKIACVHRGGGDRTPAFMYCSRRFIFLAQFRNLRVINVCWGVGRDLFCPGSVNNQQETCFEAFIRKHKLPSLLCTLKRMVAVLL